jgi:two-component system NtrC family sensor kinase
MTLKLAEAQRKLYHSDKLASLGRLAAGIAHEINNPLTGVLTFASFLHKRAADNDKTKEDLEVIIRETKRCREIVKNLLDFARQVPAQKTIIDIGEVINQSLQIIDNQLSIRNIIVKKMFPKENLPKLKVDKNQLQQVLINLIVNAADAIGENRGEILIDTSVVKKEGKNLIQIKIKDSGSGIPREALSKIFEPFFSTKGQKGTGLGLAVVWGIITEHNGTIGVESEENKGTTFTIQLPVDDGIQG